MTLSEPFARHVSLVWFPRSGRRAAAQAQINTSGGMWHLGDAEVIVPAAITSIAREGSGGGGGGGVMFQDNAGTISRLSQS